MEPFKLDWRLVGELDSKAAVVAATRNSSDRKLLWNKARRSFANQALNYVYPKADIVHSPLNSEHCGAMFVAVSPEIVTASMVLSMGMWEWHGKSAQYAAEGWFAVPPAYERFFSPKTRLDGVERWGGNAFTFHAQRTVELVLSLILSRARGEPAEVCYSVTRPRKRIDAPPAALHIPLPGNRKLDAAVRLLEPLPLGGGFRVRATRFGKDEPEKYEGVDVLILCDWLPDAPRLTVFGGISPKRLSGLERFPRPGSSSTWDYAVDLEDVTPLDDLVAKASQGSWNVSDLIDPGWPG